MSIPISQFIPPLYPVFPPGNHKFVFMVLIPILQIKTLMLSDIKNFPKLI